MQLTTLTLCSLSVSGALAQIIAGATSSTAATGAGTVVHVVKVGGMNGSLTYTPNDIQAKVGEMVQFQFMPANHSVVQSTFDAPCMPMSMGSNSSGIFSGFMPVQASATTAPTYTIMVSNTTPMWLYCSQAKHCQSGMVMAINAVASSNKTVQAFAALAKKAAANVSPTTPSGGVAGTNSTSNSPGSGTGSSNPSSTSGTAKATNSSPASAVRADASTLGMGSLFAVALALFL